MKGTGKIGMAIWAATAVTAAINAARVIIASLKVSLLASIQALKHTLTGISGASSIFAPSRECVIYGPQRRDRAASGAVQLRRDEYVFVELAEAMSLKVNFRAMAITNKLRDENIEGVTDICPSNASYMIRMDPDVLHPDDLISRLAEIDEEVGDVAASSSRPGSWTCR